MESCGLGVAVVFLAGTAFTNATQIAKALRRFVKGSVRVQVWGSALTARQEEERIEIGEAAYVSWAGTKIKPAAGTKMPALVLLTVTRHPYTMEV